MSLIMDAETVAWIFVSVCVVVLCWAVRMVYVNMCELYDQEHELAREIRADQARQREIRADQARQHLVSHAIPKVAVIPLPIIKPKKQERTLS